MTIDHQMGLAPDENAGVLGIFRIAPQQILAAVDPHGVLDGSVDEEGREIGEIETGVGTDVEDYGCSGRDESVGGSCRGGGSVSSAASFSGHRVGHRVGVGVGLVRPGSIDGSGNVIRRRLLVGSRCLIVLQSSQSATATTYSSLDDRVPIAFRHRHFVVEMRTTSFPRRRSREHRFCRLHGRGGGGGGGRVGGRGVGFDGRGHRGGRRLDGGAVVIIVSLRHDSGAVIILATAIVKAAFLGSGSDRRGKDI
mmetsp:Transcript_15155/g.30009  ORF Transcript_15155/g.30009 Transcript_15155/m.30009 type:complete len:252 (+) Transcript_15155:810-1565(+)